VLHTLINQWNNSAFLIRYYLLTSQRNRQVAFFHFPSAFSTYVTSWKSMVCVKTPAREWREERSLHSPQEEEANLKWQRNRKKEQKGGQPCESRSVTCRPVRVIDVCGGPSSGLVSRCQIKLAAYIHTRCACSKPWFSLEKIQCWMRTVFIFVVFKGHVEMPIRSN
jgi:hypothetical protein